MSRMTPGTIVPGFLHNGSHSAVFTRSYVATMLGDATAGRHCIVRKGGAELSIRASADGISDGRNSLVRDFLATDGEWLWMIDSDMGWYPQAVYDLVDSADPVARPVMGGLCFALRREGHSDLGAERTVIVPTLYEYVERPNEVGFLPVAAYPQDSVVRVAATGAAFLLIHRSALQRIRRAMGEVWFTHVLHPTGEAGKPRRFSEDLSFCVRLAQLDIPVHVNTAVGTTHDKGGIFLDEETYDRQMMLAQLMAEIDRNNEGGGS